METSVVPTVEARRGCVRATAAGAAIVAWVLTSAMGSSFFVKTQGRF